MAILAINYLRLGGASTSSSSSTVRTATHDALTRNKCAKDVAAATTATATASRTMALTRRSDCHHHRWQQVQQQQQQQPRHLSLLRDRSPYWLDACTNYLRSTKPSPPTPPPPPHDAPSIHRLPRELLHRIFVDVMETDTRSLRCVVVFAGVCRRWHRLCRHPVLWSYVAKRAFVSYPLIVRLQRYAPLDVPGKEMVQSIPLLGSASNIMWQHDTDDSSNSSSTTRDTVIATTNSMPGTSGSLDGSACRVAEGQLLTAPLAVPSPERLCQALASVRKHKACQHYYKHVQRQRSVVLNIFLSLTLLCFSLFIASAMGAAEGARCGVLCTRAASFAFLWLSYLFIAAIIVSNVVMQAHFEPQPLLLRLRNNKTLIMASAATITLGICDVVIPTVLIEVNLTRQQRFSWFWCGITVILSFCMWQCYAFVRIMPDAKEQLHQQLTSVNVKEGFQFVVLNVPNAFPLLFAAAAFCTLQYVQHGSRIYVLLGGVPVVVSLLVLSLVFLLDFLELRRAKDLSVGLCLFVASLCPLYLLIWDFRGWCLLPLAVASFGFFISHAHFVVSRALGKLLRAEGVHVAHDRY